MQWTLFECSRVQQYICESGEIVNGPVYQNRSPLTISPLSQMYCCIQKESIEYFLAFRSNKTTNFTYGIIQNFALLVLFDLKARKYAMDSF